MHTEASDIDIAVRNAIGERDRGICQSCGKKVTETIDPVKDTTENLSTIKEIPIFRWSKKCYSCGKETPIVTYNLEFNENYIIGDIPKLDEALAKKYPFVNKAYSQTQKREVIANICIHCGNMQGNWYTMEDLLEKLTEEEDMNKFIDASLPNDLSCDDILADAESRQSFEFVSPRGHVHHKDGNWKNDDIDNLVLLCENCHLKIKPHGRNASSGESRKAERQRARERRDKEQADAWRANYYAKRTHNANETIVETEVEHKQRKIPDHKSE